ncbi:MAG: DUF512 domain-containing protein [Clostridiales bacterium]|nr:DUF512 domain-containing protein [Clostridiales bacterium]
MSFKIESVDAGSPAARAGIKAGEYLVSVNGNAIGDVLDYRYYTADPELSVTLANDGGEERTVHIRNRNYLPLGLNFSTYLMDEKRSCSNRCVFCFIDQLPSGLRESLYFKDDDMRLSFLMGNYITLTNLSDEDIDKIIRLRISPINISVHTTDPKLRVRMCRNPNAGKCFDIMRKLSDSGISMNCQIVLCPGLNDGDALRKTLTDLFSLRPAVNSISVVPVGLTGHRSGLYPLRSVTREEARAVIAAVSEFGDHELYRSGERVVFASDEFYILAQLPLPSAEYYEGFDQLENGVGMVSLLKSEFSDALSAESGELSAPEPFSIATGAAAAPYIRELAETLSLRCPELKCRVFTVENKFFGGDVTVAGLLTGTDIKNALIGQDLGERLLIPASSLRYDGEFFLDDMSISELSEALSIKIIPVPNDGAVLLNAMLGRDTAQ